MMDYDGFNQEAVTHLGSTSLSPTWNPSDSSIAFTSFFKSYPYLFRVFPHNPRRRDPELLSAWPGINTAPAWSPDGKTVALVLSKDGNPEIYALRVASLEFKRLTNNRGIDSDPSWSPTGRELAFSSDRMGSAQIFIMDAEGANARRLTTGNYDTQPRWSPRGDTIVFTRRTAGGFDIWSVSPDGSNLRPLTQGQATNESASWAPTRPPPRVLVVTNRAAAALHDADGWLRATTPHARSGGGLQSDLVASSAVRRSGERSVE